MYYLVARHVLHCVWSLFSVKSARRSLSHVRNLIIILSAFAMDLSFGSTIFNLRNNLKPKNVGSEVELILKIKVRIQLSFWWTEMLWSDSMKKRCITQKWYQPSYYHENVRWVWVLDFINFSLWTGVYYANTVHRIMRSALVNWMISTLNFVLLIQCNGLL